MKVLSILVMIVIMKQIACNIWVDTAKECMTMNLLVKNVINLNWDSHKTQRIFT